MVRIERSKRIKDAYTKAWKEYNYNGFKTYKPGMGYKSKYNNGGYGGGKYYNNNYSNKKYKPFMHDNERV